MTKKILSSFVIWLLLVSISLANGGKIYMPIIIKSGDCMASDAILEITDGTTAGTINLLQAGVEIGLFSWTPAAPPVLPTMQSSPLTSGSEVSSYKFGNASESIDFVAGSQTAGNSQDSAIEMVQDFRRLLIQGINYNVVDWHNSIVYIRAKASCETNIRYAVVKTFTLPEDDAPYESPFVGGAVMDSLSVIIERGDWLGAVPGVGECQPINSIQEDWNYDSDGGWVVNTALPATVPLAMIQTVNGYIYAGDFSAGGRILRSINDGGAWAVNSVLPTNNIFDFIQTNNGNLLATDIDDIFLSPDNGASWASVYVLSGTFNNFIKLSNGEILIWDGFDLIVSNNNGTTWNTRFSLPPALTSFGNRLILLDNGEIVTTVINSVAQNTLIYKSTDNGINWSLKFSYSSPGISPASTYGLQVSDGRIYYFYGSSANFAFISTDNGENWIADTTSIFAGAFSMYQIDNGDLYLADSNRDIYISKDFGLDWALDTDITTASTVFLETTNGFLYGGDDGEIVRKTFDTIEDMGAIDTDCSGIVYLANKQNESNVSHIKIDDGGVFTDIFPMDFSGGATVALLPLVPVANDAVYFGTDTSIDNSGPFSSIVFDFSLPVTATGAYEIRWEYYDGAIWNTLISTDNTISAAGLVFSAVNVASINFEQPSDWTAVAVDGVTCYWVRARVVSVAVSITPPYQQNRQIYNIVNSFFEIDDSDIGGDIPALAEFRFKNQSDSGGKDLIKVSGSHTGANNQPILTDAGATFIADGVIPGWFILNTTDGSQAIITAVGVTTITGTLTGGTDNDWDTNDDYEIVSGPDLWSNRLITGLRSSSRGDNFRAFINISDEQNVPGITVTAGTNATFGNDATTPTGRRLTYSALAGDTTFVDRATITMTSGIVRDYYGKFHVFVRGKQHTGSSGEITMRIQLRTGSGGITFTSNEQIFQGNNDWELLDFDAFTIPAGGRVITPSELGDEGVIAIQVKNDSGGAETVYIYELVLMPTDEWVGDFTDLANEDDSIIGKQNDIKHFLDIDSVRNPKVLGRSLVRLDDSNESISSNYEFATNGEVILQANADQRVWVLSAHYGSNDEWISEPWVAWSVQAYKNQRYLTQRGSR